jgi:prophage regulatory protein
MCCQIEKGDRITLEGVYTEPVSLGGRAVGWPGSEVAALNAARISGRSNAEVRDLVVKLEAARKAVE